jgi:hypothetical protein
VILLRYVSNVVGSREGWELYIVTGGVMVGIIYSYTIFNSHPSLLPTTLGSCLSRIMFDSLMMTF